MHTTLRLGCLGALLSVLAGGCDLYDEALAASSRTAQARDVAGRSAAGAVPGAAGGAAGVGAGAGAAYGGSAGRSAAGGGAAGAAASSCGDAQLQASESCDTGIKAGLPGACPSACTSKDPCIRARLEGSGCQARCVFSAPSCADADGCCPADCTATSDSDCSASCGDGVVQTERGETCEIKPGIAVELACPSEQSCQATSACERATLTGSHSNCNLRCEKAPVTDAQSDDGCCPPGGNANVDSDCPPKCGNGVREGAEECDMTTGCGSDCKLLPKSATDMCVDKLGPNAGACERCECEQCGAAVSACVASGQTQRDASCLAVEKCATRHDCAGTECYCGNSLLLCTLEPLGACVPEIEQASGTHSWLIIQAQYLDSGSALGRAQALGDCRRDHCQAVCP